MLIYAILFILLVVLYFGTIETEGYRSETTLSEDGFVVVMSKNDAIKQLPEGYVFLDYEFIIDGCALATFHRDVTSSQSQFNTKYPVYTYIEYDYDGNVIYKESNYPNSGTKYKEWFTYGNGKLIDYIDSNGRGLDQYLKSSEYYSRKEGVKKKYGY